MEIEFGGDVADDWYSPRAALRGSVRGVDARGSSWPFRTTDLRVSQWAHMSPAG